MGLGLRETGLKKAVQYTQSTDNDGGVLPKRGEEVELEDREVSA